MRNFQNTFDTRKRSSISAFSIYMTVPLNILWMVWFRRKYFESTYKNVLPMSVAISQKRQNQHRRTFLSLLSKHFPRNHVFPRNHTMFNILNKNIIKRSYSWLTNVRSIISFHNRQECQEKVVQYNMLSLVLPIRQWSRGNYWLLCKWCTVDIVNPGYI